MATESAAPSNPTDDKPPNPASEIVQPTVEDQNDTEAGASGGISSASMFVNSEPMREEEEQNADPPQKVSNAQPDGTNQDGPVTSLSNVQSQVSTQIMQPSSAAPAGVSSTRSRFRWFYAALAALGILALCGLAVRFLVLSSAGTAVLFKKAIAPRLKSWNRKTVVGEEEGSAKKTDSKPSLEREAAAEAAKAAAAAAKAAEEAAKAAAAAAKAAAEVADMARGGQEMLLSKSEEKKYFKELMNLIGMQVNLIGMQVQEMKLMSNAIRTLEGVVDANGMSSGLNTIKIQEEQEAY